MSITSKEFEAILINYIYDKDVYKYAYENCKEYRQYINALSEDAMGNIRKGQAAMSVSNGVDKYRKGALHVATFGITALAEKAFFKSKKQRVIDLVESEDFRELFLELYESGIFF